MTEGRFHARAPGRTAGRDDTRDIDAASVIRQGTVRDPPLSNVTMLRTLSGSSGSKYRRVEASKSVDTVSGFELTITALQPSRRKTSAAWTAQ